MAKPTPQSPSSRDAPSPVAAASRTFAASVMPSSSRGGASVCNGRIAHSLVVRLDRRIRVADRRWRGAEPVPAWCVGDRPRPTASARQQPPHTVEGGVALGRCQPFEVGGEPARIHFGRKGSRGRRRARERRPLARRLECAGGTTAVCRRRPGPRARLRRPGSCRTKAKAPGTWCSVRLPCFRYNSTSCGSRGPRRPGACQTLTAPWGSSTNNARKSRAGRPVTASGAPTSDRQFHGHRVEHVRCPTCGRGAAAGASTLGARHRGSEVGIHRRQAGLIPLGPRVPLAPGNTADWRRRCRQPTARRPWAPRRS